MEFRHYTWAFTEPRKNLNLLTFSLKVNWFEHFLKRCSSSRAYLRKPSPPPESVVLYIGNFGEVVNVELSMDRVVQFPKGYGYVEFKTRSDAEKALIHMNGGQVDGNVVSARFTLPQRTKVSPPPRAVVAPNKREPSMRENIAPDTIKDGAVHRRESPPPRRKSHSPQRRSPINRREDSPPRRLDISPKGERKPSWSPLSHRRR